MEPHPTETLTLEIVPDAPAGVTILKLQGPLTIHNFVEFQDMTRKQPLPPVLLVDVSEVPYIDSAALGSLVGIHVTSEKSRTKYALVGANEKLKALFEMTNVGEFLVQYDTLGEAAGALL